MESDSYETVRRITDTHWWYVGRRTVVGGLIGRYLAPDNRARKILSVGCGTGSEFAFLSRYGDVTGVDNNENAVAFCRQSGRANRVLCADVRALPFPEASFEAVFAFDVLEHVEDDLAGVNGMFRALRDGGLCIVTVPAFEFLRNWSDDYAMHFRRYRKPRIEHVLKAGGFEILRSTYFNTILFLPVAIMKIALRRFRKETALNAEFKLYPPCINSLLTGLFRWERVLTSRFNLPFGVSLAVIARKPYAEGSRS